MTENKLDWNKINFPLTLAPMVGLSHVALRELLHLYLPTEAITLWPTEMLNSRRVPKEDLTRTPETLKLATEKFLVPQILGNEEKPIFETIQKLKNWGAHGIDINMGCPVQKALKHNYGVALMGDRAYAANVVRMAVKSSELPVSVKLRAVESANSVEDLYEFVKSLVDEGASWITLHPRTAKQKRRGQADWQQIKLLKSKFSIPIIGNGDIQNQSDILEMKKLTHCDLVMSGRALAARPWMFWQLGYQLGMTAPENDLIAGRTKPPLTRVEEGAEFGKSLLVFIELCRQYFGESLALRKISFYIKTTSPWLEFGHTLFSISTRAKSIESLKILVNDFFTQEQVMYSETDLRQ
ncbi:MAG: tRNA-dihydrouridine synthase family protein [Bdellovibrionales bacterium]|nr:tRNA-dihydrouridine synthase family protein [Bdellovibrionales bacterium]